MQRSHPVLLLSVLALAATPVLAADRPNLIAIVTDDQGRWTMGTYGNTESLTPNMDRLGKEGAVFLNAFTVTPVCSPSRASYMTGRWPTEVGITDYIAPQESDAGLGLKTSTWPMVLQKHGYTTGLIGKWHLGTKPEYHPTKMGFHHFMGFLGGGNTPMNPTLEVNGMEQRLQGPLPDILVDDAIAFLKENRQRPFALCLHFRAPHLPYGPVPDVDWAPFAQLDPKVPTFPGADIPKVKEAHRRYYASIASVDRNLGRLLSALDELRLAQNTIVSFTSDHGYNEGRHGVNTKGNASWIAGGVNGPKRPNMWDTSIRVPLVLRWPAAVKPGTVIADHISNLDMFRSVLGMLGVPVPDGQTVHGIDFSPALRGERLRPRDALFGQYDLHNGGLAYMRMIRTGKHKYVRFHKANMLDELYDLQADPDEARNLLAGRGNGRHNAVLTDLQQRLLEWQRSIDDPVLKSAY